MAWRCVALCGVAWRCVAWRGVAWRGLAWRRVVWCQHSVFVPNAAFFFFLLKNVVPQTAAVVVQWHHPLTIGIYNLCTVSPMGTLCSTIHGVEGVTPCPRARVQTVRNVHVLCTASGDTVLLAGARAPPRHLRAAGMAMRAGIACLPHQDAVGAGWLQRIVRVLLDTNTRCVWAFGTKPAPPDLRQLGRPGSSLVCGQGEWKGILGPSMFKTGSTRMASSVALRLG